MKNSALMHMLINKINPVLVAFCVSAVAGSSAYAEDIEIYEGLVGDASVFSIEQKNKPNILFVLDTSGSMGTPEVVLGARPQYDASVDYGEPGTDDAVYIYDDNRNYTGMYVDDSDNNCKAAEDFHVENPQFPEYVDRALVWAYTEEQTESVETCANDTEETHTDTSNTPRRWNTVHLFDVDPGTELSISVTVQSYGEIAYYFWNAAGNKVANTNYCYQFIDDFQTVNCPAVTVPNSARQLRVRYYPYDAYFGDNATVTLATEGVCTTETMTTPEAGDWMLDAPADSEIEALECELDNGVHGPSDSSPQLYPRYQAGNDNLSDPKYTTAAGNANAVDWNASALEERLLVPTNYHEYLQTPVGDLLGGVVVEEIDGSDIDDVKAYCLADSFVQATGGSNTRIYPNAGNFAVQDGFFYECQTRMGALKDATTSILSSMSGANAGLMRFNSDDGGSLIAAIEDIDSSETIIDPDTTLSTEVTTKSKLIKEVLRLPGAGSTPLQETLYEAYLYFAGLAPGSTGAEKNLTNDADSSIDFPTDLYETTDDITDAEGIVDGKYVSPILNQCQDNNIILFSDGSATVDVGRKTEIEAVSGLSCSDSINGDCLDELAYALANTDVNTEVKLDNHVYLHTIGFGSDLTGSPQLVSASNQALRPGADPDTQHYDATSTEDLINAFQTILLSIENVEADSFIAPAVAVNAFNRLQYREDLYFALFEPSNSPRWSGNLKKYQVRADGNIVDQNGAIAVDDTGFFHNNASSFWDPIVDGNDVALGGVARQLDLDPERKLYANLKDDADDVYLLTKDNFLGHILKPSISDVTNIGATNSFTSVVFSLIGTGTVFGSGGLYSGDAIPNISLDDIPENTANVIKWTLGEDVEKELDGAETDPNFYLGESLHGTPYVLDFGSYSEGILTDGDGNPIPATDDEGNALFDEDNNPIFESGSVQESEDILFATTNQGLLHAINGDTGEELWAYIPGPDLFSNLGAYFNNVIDADHRYGLDGEIEFDIERDAVTREVTKAHLFMGQRRGGSKYFAIDVTNADLNVAEEAPVEKMWTIENLPRMGQSWAKPVAATIEYCVSDNDCGLRDVLVISGGYDLKYDDYDPTAAGAADWLEDLEGTVDGNAIYIVARDSGALLWSASNSEDNVDTSKGYSIFPEMNHSFPSEPTVIDADFDGVADLMFAVDIAGRVWRIDFRGDVKINDEGQVIIDDSDIHVGNNSVDITGTATSTGSENLGNEVAGGIIADLTESGVNRLFYNKLDVSITPRTDQDLARYNLVTGSGYRAHPLTDEGINNRLYFIFDRNIQFPQFVDEDGDKLPDAVSYDYARDINGDGSISLSQVSANDIGEKDNSITLEALTTHRNGFYINLATGTKEKMINPTLTDEGVVIAVSYSPTSVVTNASGDICEKNIGSSSLYQIDLYSGEAARLDLAKAGISTKPIVIEVADTDPNNIGGTVKILIIGSESFDASKSRLTTDGDIDKLITPGLNDSNLGQVIKVNWWERRN